MQQQQQQQLLLQQQQQQQQPSSFSSFNSRFLFDQFYSANEPNTNNDPFASSAPSPSHFPMLSLDERRSRIMSNNDSQQLLPSNKPYLYHSNSSNSSSSGGINIAQQQSLHSIPERNGSYRSYHHQQQEEEDVNDFMLPSSLNDLLTPNELLQQLQFPTTTTTTQRWNVPFYTNGTSYSYDDSSPLQPSSRYQQPINISSGGSSSSNSNNNLDFIVDYPDEEGPFIMEDTVNQCIEPSKNSNSTAATENYLTTFNIIKHH